MPHLQCERRNVHLKFLAPGCVTPSIFPPQRVSLTLLHSVLHPSQSKAYHNKAGAAISTLLDSSKGFLIPSWFLTSCTQYITCVTHLGKTLDRWYGSVLNVYRAISLYPLGPLNPLITMPSSKKRTKTIKQWTKEEITHLQLLSGVYGLEQTPFSARPLQWAGGCGFLLSTFVKWISFHQSLSLSWPTTNLLLPRSWRKSPTRRCISSLGLRWRQRRSTRAFKVTKVESKIEEEKGSQVNPNIDQLSRTALYFISPVICFLILYFHCILMLCWFIFIIRQCLTGSTLSGSTVSFWRLATSGDCGEGDDLQQTTSFSCPPAQIRDAEKIYFQTN